MNSNKQISRVCIYGIGGVGGYFGGKIAVSLNSDDKVNCDLSFIARGEHCDAVKQNGITVVTPGKTLVGRPTRVTGTIEDIPTPDLFLICVKSYDLDDVVTSIRSKVNPDTVIMPLLNGADIYDRIRANLKDGIVLPACVFVGTHIDRPGVINQNGGDGNILFGCDPKLPGFKADHVIDFFGKAGINCQWHHDPYPAIWQKYIFIASFGMVTVLTGKTLGEIIDDTKAKAIVAAIMGEIHAIATAKGIMLPEDIIETAISKAKNFPYNTKTSYQRDVETKGRINEGDLYGGMITRSAKALGISAPVTEKVYRQIQNRWA